MIHRHAIEYVLFILCSQHITLAGEMVCREFNGFITVFLNYSLTSSWDHVTGSALNPVRLSLALLTKTTLQNKTKQVCVLPSFAGNWVTRETWELKGGGRMPAESVLHLQVQVLPAFK